MTAVVLPQEVAESVLAELGEVWDRIGVAQNERDAAISDLVQQVRNIFYAKLKEENERKNSLQCEIDETLKRISSLETAVGNAGVVLPVIITS